MQHNLCGVILPFTLLHLMLLLLTNITTNTIRTPTMTHRLAHKNSTHYFAYTREREREFYLFFKIQLIEGKWVPYLKQMAYYNQMFIWKFGHDVHLNFYQRHLSLALTLSGKKKQRMNQCMNIVPEIYHQFASLVCSRMKFTSHAFDRTNNGIDTS